MSLLKALVNLGAAPSDASVFDAYYANADERDFLDGLEIISRAIATRTLQTIAPACQPWQDIHARMLINGDAEQAFFEVLANYDPPLQVAMAQVVSNRVSEIKSFEAKLNQSTGKRKKSGDYLKILHHLGYAFKYNLVTQEVEVNGNRLTDELAQKIRKQARDSGVWEVGAVADAYGAEAYENRYNPIRDYLSQLKWDGEDTIAKLCDYFTDETGVFATWLRRWLVGAVARVHGSHQNRVLILDGPQDMGKSKFVEWLASPLPEYFHANSVNPDNKDDEVRLMTVWIWEINEFGSTSRRADREKLKAYLTTERVRVRRPYGRFDVTGPAITSFIGTVNNEQNLLSDPTGSRRFMIAHLKSIDWAYKKIDVDQVWAQTYALYLANEPWNLTADERKLSNEINESYRMVDLVEETIKEQLLITSDPNDWMSTVEILNVLKDPYKGNLKPNEVDTRKLATALTKLGLEKPTNKRRGLSVIRGYTGIKIGP